MLLTVFFCEIVRLNVRFSAVGLDKKRLDYFYSETVEATKSKMNFICRGLVLFCAFIQTAFTFAMLSSLLHDSCYCGGFALNTLLIALIVTRTPTYLRQVFFNELRKFRHYRELHTQFRCYSIVLLYLSVFEISIATSSLLIHKTLENHFLRVFSDYRE